MLLKAGRGRGLSRLLVALAAKTLAAAGGAGRTRKVQRNKDEKQAPQKRKEMN